MEVRVQSEVKEGESARPSSISKGCPERWELRGEISGKSQHQGRQLQRVQGASLKGQAQAGKWQVGWGGGEGLGPDRVLGVGHPAPSGSAEERQESWSLGKLPRGRVTG